MILCEYQIVKGSIALNQGRDLHDRGGKSWRQAHPCGIALSLFEVNPALRFDRLAARGFRLNIAAGTAVRFERGQKREVELVRVAGAQRIVGFRSEVMGALEADNE